MAKDSFGGVSDQRRAARERLVDAQALLEASRQRGAMYLGGYAVECLLKARLMQRLGCRTLTVLETELKRRTSLSAEETIFTHSLMRLLTLADARDRLASDPVQWRRFAVVNQWIPAWRYAPEPRLDDAAEKFLRATAEIVRWIENNV